MRIEANERTLPTLHLAGTLAIVLLLTLALGGFFLLRSQADQQAALQRLSQTLAEQQRNRLQAELDSALNFIEFTRSRTEGVLRENLRAQVDSVMSLVQAIFERESPRRPAPEVQALIREALRPVRFFEGRGYFFIDTLEGRFVLLPTAPQLEGKLLPDNRDDTGHPIMRGLIEAARQPVGDGFSRYRWYPPDDPKHMADKIAYVRRFAPYDWLIGTGDYTRYWEQQIQQQALERLRSLVFGRSGHISVFDADGRALIWPADHAQEGRMAADFSADQRPDAQALLEQATRGGGAASYSVPGADGQPIQRSALVKRVAPWGWVVVASIRNDELQAALGEAMALQRPDLGTTLRDLLPALALALVLSALASTLFARWLSRLFAHYHRQMQAQAQTLARGEALFRAVFENAAVGLAQVAPDGRLLQVNTPFCALLDRAREELVQRTRFQDITLPEDLPTDLAHVDRLLRGEADHYSLEKRYVRGDGSPVWVHLAVHLVRDAHGEPDYFISAVYDISQRKSDEARLKLWASVFTYAREGIIIAQADGRIVEVNDSFTRITGFSRAEALGKTPKLLQSGQQSAAFYAELWRSLNETGHWSGELWNRRRDDSLFAVLQTISAVIDDQGRTTHYVSLFSDITAAKEHERQLEHIAHFDALTQLPNRSLLADRLQQAMLQAQRRGLLLAVAYLDLDGFKQINDRYGHDAGDMVLTELARRLHGALREGDTLARLGGDEFVAVLGDLNGTEDCKPLLQRMLDVAAQPIAHQGHSLQVSASLGVTFFPQQDDIDADQLQRQADQAMYQAKLAGKNRYHLFDTELDRSLRGSHESREQVRHALQSGQLVLHYQPKVDLRGGVVMGAEALIRWQHPEHGLLAPGHFLPAIENHPLMVDVGHWVLRTALAQLQDWAAAGLPYALSVNVAARQLQQSDFADRLKVLLAEHPGVAPQRLELEVLETSALQDIGGVSHTLERCRALGVSLSLDDFGTGYSSLTYLKRLPVQTLKIDQSFVRDMLDDADDLAILQGVIGLARAFGRNVIAEGVETPAHGRALLALGCDWAQGYGIARPMPAHEFLPWAAAWKPDAQWQLPA
ncbi:MAG: hypothetical protein Fur007_03630 [Rhodoferax sp.]